MTSAGLKGAPPLKASSCIRRLSSAESGMVCEASVHIYISSEEAAQIAKQEEI
jgi:hypothetical protein